MKISTARVFLLLILLVSCGLIFYKYLQVPGNLSYDEVEFAKLALSLNGKSYTPYSSLATGHATLYFYILLFSLKLFGITNFALRFPAAIFGVLSAVIFYATVRLIYKSNTLAFFTTIIFVSLRWFFQFARFSFEATFLLFLELTATYFLFKYLKNKSIKPGLLSGLFAGLAFNSYYPGRLFFLLPLVFIFLYGKRKHLVYFLVVFFITISPLVVYLSTHPDTRVNQLSVLSDQALSPTQKFSQINLNVQKTALMFFVAGDLNGRHNYPGKPAVNPLVGILFVAGLLMALKKRKSVYNQFFLLYFFLSLLPPILTRTAENPHMLRTVTVLPALAYFVGVSFQYVEKFTPIKKNAMLIISLIVLLSAAYEARTYFVYQSRVFRNAFEVHCPLQDVINYPIDNIPSPCIVTENLF